MVRRKPGRDVKTLVSTGRMVMMRFSGYKKKKMHVELALVTNVVLSGRVAAATRGGCLNWGG